MSKKSPNTIDRLVATMSANIRVNGEPGTPIEKAPRTHLRLLPTLSGIRIAIIVTAIGTGYLMSMSSLTLTPLVITAAIAALAVITPKRRRDHTRRR